MEHLSLVKPLVQCSITPLRIHTHAFFNLAGDDFSYSAQQMTTNQSCVATRVFLWPKNEHS